MPDFILPDIRPNPLADPYTEDDMLTCAKAHARLKAALNWCERILVDGVRYGVATASGERHTGSYEYGGEYVNGKMQGALFVDNRRTRYERVPEIRLVAEWLDQQEDGDVRYQALVTLLEKQASWPDRFINLVTNKWPGAMEYCKQAEEDAAREGMDGVGFVPMYGEWEITVRANGPEEGKHEVGTPQESPDV